MSWTCYDSPVHTCMAFDMLLDPQSLFLFLHINYKESLIVVESSNTHGLAVSESFHKTASTLGPVFQETRDLQQLGNLWFMYTVGFILWIPFFRWSEIHLPLPPKCWD